jgi:hypothetical protein
LRITSRAIGDEDATAGVTLTGSPGIAHVDFSGTNLIKQDFKDAEYLCDVKFRDGAVDNQPCLDFNDFMAVKEY